jgi:hypothetical protein
VSGKGVVSMAAGDPKDRRQSVEVARRGGIRRSAAVAA